MSYKLVIAVYAQDLEELAALAEVAADRVRRQEAEELLARNDAGQPVARGEGSYMGEYEYEVTALSAGDSAHFLKDGWRTPE